MAYGFMGYSRTRREDHAMIDPVHECRLLQIMSAYRYKWAQDDRLSEGCRAAHIRYAAFYAAKAREILFQLIGDNEDESI
ncbi:hypothetical protein [Rhizobium phage RHph_X2_28B]|uniref:hypothetical protein n=1 Tax=Rhizobium phage RHph_X2_28B TaxID=2836086 RepID=UPI0023290940|nr:hypothetical protein PP751_gp008 [Rhizobium phage RHph_X2_28B]QWY83460.1 hypothetical protein [Rhizobium phage RHph_X2_28B]QWY83696.1 hypothetical protein [Rhizobium phage RHph_X3_15]